MGAARIHGNIVSAVRDTLWISAEGRQIAFPFEQVEGLQVSRGRNRFVPGMLGFGAGLVGGGIAGLFIGAQQGESVDAQSFSALNGAGYGMVIGAPVGALVGALIGSERWERVAVRPNVEIRRSGAGFSLAVAVR
jgi:hypothetical protein